MDVESYALAKKYCDDHGGATPSWSSITDKPATFPPSSHTHTEITDLIPAQATTVNKLADKEFVNSSISTETAHYIYKTVGNEKVPFDSVAELEAYSGTITNNDYAFVSGTDASGNAYYDRYKATVSGSTVIWAKEFRLNNSSFTAEQWAAISSGMTSSDKTKLNGIEANANNYVLPQASSSAIGGIKVWEGTQAQYDAIATKDSDTYYFIREA